LPGLENLPIYDQGTLLGNISFEKNCQFLRIWQVDLNRDEKIDFMTESLCDKSFLKYQFYGQDLQKLFSDVHYKPALTIINYDNFEMITFRDKAPSFKLSTQDFQLLILHRGLTTLFRAKLIFTSCRQGWWIKSGDMK
jgi:hypothetical protein